METLKLKRLVMQMETAIILIGAYHAILALQLCESQPTATMVENILQKKKQSDSGTGENNERIL